MNNSLFGKFYSPYMKHNNSTIDDCYSAYKQDPDRTVEIDGHIYTKIISHCRFYGYEDFSFHIIWEPYTEMRRNDILVDENGNEYRVRSLEMIHFGGEIPEWYLKALPMVITGSSEHLGSYLAKKQVENDVQ